MWLHIAREYTERWRHQQQVREAVGRPLLTGPDWFAPVLATFVHGLPRTCSEVSAPTGTTVRVTISEASGRTWSVARIESEWARGDNEIAEPEEGVMSEKTVSRERRKRVLCLMRRGILGNDSLQVAFEKWAFLVEVRAGELSLAGIERELREAGIDVERLRHFLRSDGCGRF